MAYGVAAAGLASCSADLRIDAEAIAASGLSEAEAVYIHGAGDSPADWADGIAAAEGGFAIDWSVDAAERMAAPARGYEIGLDLARYLEDSPRTLYAHSAGAWLAQGIADGLAERGASARPSIVFLDPFTALSVLQLWAGSRMLGLNAESCETWYTTLDGIPFTDGAVAAGDIVNLDDSLEASGTEAHWAVVDWYFENRR